MEQRLKELFESDDFLGQDLAKFRKFAKERIPEVTNRQLEDFYKKNTLKQIMTPFKSKRKFNPIVTLKPNSVLYFDSLFMKQDGIAVIVAMNLFSKKAYALAVKLKKKTTKKDGSIIPGTSVKAEDSLRLLERILQSDPYKEIRTDGGSEFKDVFQEYIRNTRGLTQNFLIDQSKRLNSPIERFVRTFRNLYQKKKEIKNGRVYGDRQRFVDEIINTYNNTRHSTIGFTPNQVYNNEENSFNIVKEKYKQRIRNSTPAEEILPVGTKVRIFAQKKIGGQNSIFNKTGQNWSKTVYTIGEDTYNETLKRYNINGKNLARDYILIVTVDPESESRQDPVRIRRRGRPRGPRRNPDRERNVPERFRE